MPINPCDNPKNPGNTPEQDRRDKAMRNIEEKLKENLTPYPLILPEGTIPPKGHPKPPPILPRPSSSIPGSGSNPAIDRLGEIIRTPILSALSAGFSQASQVLPKPSGVIPGQGQESLNLLPVGTSQRPWRLEKPDSYGYEPPGPPIGYDVLPPRVTTRKPKPLPTPDWDLGDSESYLGKPWLGKEPGEKTVREKFAEKPFFSKQSTKKGLQGGLEDLEAGIGATSDFGRAGNMLSAAGNIAGMFGPYGKAIEGGLKFAAVLFKGVEKLEQWNLTLRQADLQLARYSGDMAKVMAEQQVWEIRFAQERGRARSWSARFREESMRDMKQGMAPIGDVLKNTWDVGLGLLGQIVYHVSPILVISNMIQQLLDSAKKEGPDISVGGMFANIANAGWMENYGSPLNFGKEWYQTGDPRP